VGLYVRESRLRVYLTILLVAAATAGCNQLAEGECRDNSDCENGQTCDSPELDPSSCGICPQSECVGDEGCSGDAVCEPVDWGCSNCPEILLCVAACTPGDCPESQTCNESTGHCEGTVCEEDSECPDPFRCRSGHCERSECDTTSDCRSGSACDQGACVERECVADDECDSLHRCNGGICSRLHCDWDADCHGQGLCVEGRCYEEAGSCRGGEVAL